MTVLKSRYYNVNRILLLVWGLWPYQNKFRYARAVFTLGIFVAFVVYQSMLMFIAEYNFKLALKICSDIFPAILCILQFIAFLIKPIEVKKLLNQICEEWSALKDSREIEIAKQYGMFTRRLTEALLYKCFFCKFRYFSVCALLCWIFLVLMHFVPIINNSAVTNESFLQDDVLMQQFEKKYLFKERYAYLFFVIVFVGVFVMTSTTSMVLAYMRHICAMLKICCYRIERSLDGNISHMSISQKNRLMHQKLISAVNIQRRAMEFTQRALDSFKESYFFLIGIGVISLAINMLNALEAALIANNANELAISTFYVIIHFLYIFIGNYGGQTITDHSAAVLKNLYHVQWYVAPLQVQKLILFLMLRNTKHFGLVIGGIYVASLEGFITLTSMSVSYFMVIYSTQR
ncbi:PREDICTED: odorant receptor 49b-like isoform X2 [Vollenhovia emeryi]|uniref:odorant receptor 49b-like isoform X2 n=1 Tax=Vollenhovia emeryi TaxID=411798 RepID=UPI0005F548B2|nr:PREDICTED: odorant receptor 49b-like isoform X2 [Vollenhovia emeryi]